MSHPSSSSECFSKYDLAKHFKRKHDACLKLSKALEKTLALDLPIPLFRKAISSLDEKECEKLCMLSLHAAKSKKNISPVYFDLIDAFMNIVPKGTFEMLEPMEINPRACIQSMIAIKNLDRKISSVVVEGGIGAGKTTLIKDARLQFATAPFTPKVICVPEFDEKTYAILAEFREGGYDAFSFQCFMIFSKMNQLVNAHIEYQMHLWKKGGSVHNAPRFLFERMYYGLKSFAYTYHFMGAITTEQLAVCINLIELFPTNMKTFILDTPVYIAYDAAKSRKTRDDDLLDAGLCYLQAQVETLPFFTKYKANNTVHTYIQRDITRASKELCTLFSLL